ncbi:hypothetical protein diail_2809 [Diaporthe ilicicola]|nr:hypothetical protein diail_2809 [Diaporthe ilicicola]
MQKAVLSTKLNVTVIGAAHGKSRFECWELAAPFKSSAQPGIVGSQTLDLGDVANITYNVLPAGFDCGLHAAPFHQWVVVLQGLGVITMPHARGNSTELVVKPGEAGLLFATDTADVSREGHGCYFPGVTESVFIQIPAEGDRIPEHRVLYVDSPCAADEYVELRSWATSA